MSLVLLAQIALLAVAAFVAATATRRLRDTHRRRAAAFEAFAQGRGLHLYAIAGKTPVYRLSDDAGTTITVETPPATLATVLRPRAGGTVTLALPSPRLARGFVAVRGGTRATGGKPEQQLDRMLRGVGRASDPVSLRVLPLGSAVALLADVAAEETPDLDAIHATLEDAALRPGADGTALIGLNAEGLHLRLGRTIADPRELGPIVDAMQRLRMSLMARHRRKAA
ncbi:MAG: hypothetical protein KDK12_19950 [Rhodobacteraceae bacterium]|nr:hypothetical protein [Paracoccaceae bacterium]